MNLNIRATYTVNNGDTKTKSMSIEMPDGFTDTPIERIAVMSKAADQLVEKGQIMVSDVEILQNADAA